MVYVVTRRGNMPLDWKFPTWQLTAMSKLREYRKAKGLSQAQLAERAGCTKPTISKLERGKSTASGALIKRLVKAAGGELTADDILSAESAA